jgi:integrase
MPVDYYSLLLQGKEDDMRPFHAPYCIYRKQTKAGCFWYVRYWDESARKYSRIRSTGISVKGRGGSRHAAEEAARTMLQTIRFTPEAPDKLFAQYLADFWTPGSPYVRERALVGKRPFKMNHEDVRRHIETFPEFRGITLRGLTAGMLRDWLTWMAEKKLSGHRINHVLQGMRIAIKYAVGREELDRDPFKNIGEAEEQPREKGILTPGEVSSLVQAPAQDPRTRLAVLLGMLCGLRRGEVRGLLWEDIGDGIITVCHNWIDGEGVKAPKCKGGAIRENKRPVPLPAPVAAVLEAVRQILVNPAPDHFVFESMRHPGEPLSNNFVRYAVDKELKDIGISQAQQKERNLTPHSLRHTFVTLGRMAGITDIEIRALAGHRSAGMTERYSHAGQVIDFDAVREKLQKAIG